MDLLLAGLIAGFILDLIIGDPRGLWHPVQGIGNLITLTERGMRKLVPNKRVHLIVAGGLLVIIVVVCAMFIPAAILYLSYQIHPMAAVALNAIFCGILLATKSLKLESEKVATALEEDGVEAGRKAVAMIVGRDTKSLSEEGIMKATIETVAENTSDGVIAPLFYMMIGGSVLGFGYKAINTMDSMIGYHNDEYEDFGKCAAILDDVVNFIPARLSALFMLIGTMFGPWNAKEAMKAYRQDRKAHKSPNAAQTESVMAGALGVELAGDGFYFGVLHKKPTIGKARKKIEISDIYSATKLLYRTAMIGLLIMGSVRWLIYWMI